MRQLIPWIDSQEGIAGPSSTGTSYRLIQSLPKYVGVFLAILARENIVVGPAGSLMERGALKLQSTRWVPY